LEDDLIFQKPKKGQSFRRWRWNKNQT